MPDPRKCYQGISTQRYTVAYVTLSPDGEWEDHDAITESTETRLIVEAQGIRNALAVAEIKLEDALPAGYKYEIYDIGLISGDLLGKSEEEWDE